MEYRHLGSAGLEVSALSLGAWITYGGQVDEKTSADCMRAAREAGVNFFDNAEVYSDGAGERVMGEVIRKLGWKRSDLVVSTKIFWGGSGPNDCGLSRKHIMEGLDASLGRLQLDYVDIVFCHRPDLRTPVEETVRAMNAVIDRGKAFYWGTSEWSADQITEAAGIARRERLIGPQVEQPQYNMFHRRRVEVEYLRLYASIGLGTTTWSPLASGVLTGKYSRGVTAGTRLALAGYEWLKETVLGPPSEKRLEKVDALAAVARGIGATPAQLAIAWCLKNPHVSSVITGASTPEQVEENMRASEMVGKLTDALMDRIEGILENQPEPPEDFR